MPFLHLPKRTMPAFHTGQKPNGIGVELDTRNSYARDVAMALPMTRIGDLTNFNNDGPTTFRQLTFGTLSSGATWSTQGGVCLDFAAAADDLTSDQTITEDVFGTTPKLTFLVQFVWTNPTTGVRERIFGWGGDTLVAKDTDEQLSSAIYMGFAAGDFGSAITQNTKYTWASAINGNATTVDIYQRTRDETYSDTGIVQVAVSASEQNFVIGCSHNLVGGIIGRVYGLVMWNRELTTAEINEIVFNPWQMFKPKVAPVYFFPTAAAAATPGVQIFITK